MRVQILIDGMAFFDSGDRYLAANTHKVLATLWAGMNDDDQTQFFAEVGRVMDSWGGAKADYQAEEIANHLLTCECSSPRTRNILREIADRLDERETP